MEINDSLVDLFDNVFQDVEFDNENAWYAIRHIVEWIDLATAFYDGKITDEVCDSAYQMIRFLGTTYKRLQSPVIWSRLDFIYEYRDNVTFLLKKRLKDSSLYYSALPQITYLSTYELDPYYNLARYFLQNPLSSFSSAARVLKIHPTTVSENYKKLESLFFFKVSACTNRWLFGIRTFVLFFEVNSIYDAIQIREKIFSYPFFNVFSKDMSSNHHYISFLIPDDENIVCQFEKSITLFSSIHFKSFRLHEIVGMDYNSWTDSLSRTGWQIPKLIRENDYPPLLDTSFRPRAYKSKNDSEQTYRDFIVLCLSSPNMRHSASKIIKSNIAISNGISQAEAYYRRKKLLKKEVLFPMAFCYVREIQTVRLEVICSKEVSHVLISAAITCTSVLYSLTTDGVILFLHIPMQYLSVYAKYFVSLLDDLNIVDYRVSINRHWHSGQSLLDIVRNWKYGPRGFTTEGLDISSNIFDYIK